MPVRLQAHSLLVYDSPRRLSVPESFTGARREPAPPSITPEPSNRRRPRNSERPRSQIDGTPRRGAQTFGCLSLIPLAVIVTISPGANPDSCVTIILRSAPAVDWLSWASPATARRTTWTIGTASPCGCAFCAGYKNSLPARQRPFENPTRALRRRLRYAPPAGPNDHEIRIHSAANPRPSRRINSMDLIISRRMHGNRVECGWQRGAILHGRQQC